MIVLLSPAKSLNFDKIDSNLALTTPVYARETQSLITILRKKTTSDLMDLMSISENLAKLNAERYKNFNYDEKSPSKAAIFAFTGDVYQGLDAGSLKENEINFLQTHMRILSGLYGLIKPLDQIQAYRLEMGTNLPNQKGKNLYDFWKEKITKNLKGELQNFENPWILNLASNEYANAVDFKKLKVPVVAPVFKEFKNGQLKFISFNAKKARGLMSRFVAQNEVDEPKELLQFNLDGYAYQADGSKENQPLFTR